MIILPNLTISYKTSDRFWRDSLFIVNYTFFECNPISDFIIAADLSSDNNYISNFKNTKFIIDYYQYYDLDLTSSYDFNLFIKKKISINTIKRLLLSGNYGNKFYDIRIIMFDNNAETNDIINKIFGDFVDEIKDPTIKHKVKKYIIQYR